MTVLARRRYWLAVSGVAWAAAVTWMTVETQARQGIAMLLAICLVPGILLFYLAFRQPTIRNLLTRSIGCIAGLVVFSLVALDSSSCAEESCGSAMINGAATDVLVSGAIAATWLVIDRRTQSRPRYRGQHLRQRQRVR